VTDFSSLFLGKKNPLPLDLASLRSRFLQIKKNRPQTYERRFLYEINHFFAFFDVHDRYFLDPLHERSIEDVPTVYSMNPFHFWIMYKHISNQSPKMNRAHFF
jgi:hypothetical protein